MQICCLLLVGLMAGGVAGADYSIDAESDRQSLSRPEEHPDDDSPFEFHAAIYMRGNINRCGQYKDFRVCAIMNGMQITKGRGKAYKFYFRRSEQKQQIKFYKDTTTLEHHRDTVLLVLPPEDSSQDEYVIARTKNPKRIYIGTRYGFNYRDQITMLEPMWTAE